MKRSIWLLGLGLAVCLLAGNAAAQGGCKSDAQCKGDRVCVKGECVRPPAKKKAAPGKPEAAPPPKEAAPAEAEEQQEAGGLMTVAVAAFSLMVAEAEEQQEGGGLGETTPDEQDMEEAIDLGEQAETEWEGELEAAPEPGPPFAFSVGLRVGYGIPTGEAQEESPMSDTYNGKVPIWLDLGFKVTRNILVGLYGQYAFGLIKKGACVRNDCTGSITRFGIQGHYEVSPGETVNPWVGLGIGYEWSHVSGPVDYPALGRTIDTDVTLGGWEFANIQGGAQFEVAKNISVGPFLSVSVGQYSNCSAELAGVDQNCDLERDLGNKAIHQWLLVGARGVFEFWPFAY